MKNYLLSRSRFVGTLCMAAAMWLGGSQLICAQTQKAEQETVTVSFALGDQVAEGTLPASKVLNIGEMFEIPVNHSLYVEGQTLSGWTDGVVDYSVGAVIEVVRDVTLTPLFKKNTTKFNRRTATTTISWPFATASGANAINATGSEGLVVSQATFNNKQDSRNKEQIDVKLAYNTAKGTINNTSAAAQCDITQGATITLPAAHGMKVTLEGVSDLMAANMTGTQNKKTSGGHLVLDYVDDLSTATITFTKDCALKNLKVEYPAPDSTTIATLPSGLETAIWTMTGSIQYTTGYRYNTEELLEQLEVASDGKHMYIMGLNSVYLPEVWVKGRIEGDKVIFPVQRMGNYNLLGDLLTHYLCEWNEDLADIDDVVFNLSTDDKGRKVLKPESMILINGMYDRLFWFSAYRDVTITEGLPDVGEVAQLPEGLTPVAYAYNTKGNYYLGEDAGFIDYELKRSVYIAIDGTDAYIQGLDERYFPEAWVKGTVEGNTITVPYGQLIAKEIHGKYQWQYYLNGGAHQTYSGGDVADIVFEIDPETGAITAPNNSIVVSTNRSANYTTHYYQNISLQKLEDKADFPAAPVIKNIAESTTNPYIVLNLPTTNLKGDNLIVQKLQYQLFSETDHEVSPVKLSATDYPSFGKDIDVIDYTLTDRVELQKRGENTFLFLLMDTSKWNRVGVKMIYNGGGQQNESQTVWYTWRQYTGIDQVDNDSEQGLSSQTGDQVFDLQGRKVDAQQLGKGIYVRNGKKFYVR